MLTLPCWHAAASAGNRLLYSASRFRAAIQEPWTVCAHMLHSMLHAILLLSLLKRSATVRVWWSLCAGLNGIPGLTAYTASKHAVVGMMRCAAAEYGPLGLRVNCINPGATGERRCCSRVGTISRGEPPRLPLEGKGQVAGMAVLGCDSTVQRGSVSLQVLQCVLKRDCMPGERTCAPAQY